MGGRKREGEDDGREGGRKGTIPGKFLQFYRLTRPELTREALGRAHETISDIGLKIQMFVEKQACLS